MSRFPRDWTISWMAQEIDELDRLAIEYVIDGDQRLRKAEAEVERADQSGNGQAIATAHATLDEAGGYTARARAGSLLNGLGFKPERARKAAGRFLGRLAHSSEPGKSPDVPRRTCCCWMNRPTTSTWKRWSGSRTGSSAMTAR